MATTARREGRLYTQPPRSSFSKTLVFDGSDPLLKMLTAEVKGAPLFDTTARIKGSLRTPDGQPVKQVYVAEDESWQGTIKECSRVYEYAGNVVTLTDGELDGIKGDDDRIVRITAFTDAFDPMYVEKTHVLWWAEDKDTQQYDILLALLRSKPDHVFIGTTVERGTTKAIAIRYSENTGTLVAHVCLYAENLRQANVNTVREGIHARVIPTDEEIEAISGVFDGLRVDPALDMVTDEYAARLEAAIMQKIETGEVTVKAPEQRTVETTVDLMAALKASLAGGGTPKEKAARVTKKVKEDQEKLAKK